METWRIEKINTKRVDREIDFFELSKIRQTCLPREKKVKKIFSVAIIKAA